jgi:FkbH-like protein
VFPIEATFGSKAEAVARVLRAWNIDAESVVYVDDSAIEIAEVEAAHPSIECLQFSPDSQSLYSLLERLRDECGRAMVTAEDEIRRESVRRLDSLRASAGADAFSEALLERACAELTLAFAADTRDARALELVNKTNQFNLNGRRHTERTWAECVSRPGGFLLTATYKDRFGPLGKIAVLAGYVEADEVRLETWAMSCRAFGRRIEYQCLKALFERWHVPAIRLAYVETSRNGPLTRVLAQLLGEPPTPTALLKAEAFDAACPRLWHRVIRDGVDDGRYARASG